MDCYIGPHTALTLALHGGLYVDILMDLLYRAPNCPYYSLAWRNLISNYNSTIWMAPHCTYYSLARSPPFSQNNGQLLRSLNKPYYILAWSPLINQYNGPL
jgi:hypothetical protein